MSSIFVYYYASIRFVNFCYYFFIPSVNYEYSHHLYSSIIASRCSISISIVVIALIIFW